MLCIPLWKGYFKIRGTKEDPIPYVIKMKFTYVPDKCGIIDPDVNDEYIGETSRTFVERYKEHLKEPSPIFGCCDISGHCTNPDNFTIIGMEDHGLARIIKESIYIRVNSSTLNRNVGKLTYTIYGTESYLAPQNLELTNIWHAHTIPISGHAQTLQTNRHAHGTIGTSWACPENTTIKACT